MLRQTTKPNRNMSIKNPFRLFRLRTSSERQQIMYLVLYLLLLSAYFGDGLACLTSGTRVSSNQSGIQFYYYVTTQSSFQSAQANCVNHGENLPFFYFQSELDEYNVLITGCNVDLWIGLNASANVPASSYKCVDGSTPVISNWGTSQPATDGTKRCAKTGQSATSWSNDDCTQQYSYICIKRNFTIQPPTTTTTTMKITTTTSMKPTTTTTTPKATTSTTKISTTTVKLPSTTTTLKLPTTTNTPTPSTSSATTKTSTASFTKISIASTSTNRIATTKTAQTEISTSTLITQSETSAVISTSLGYCSSTPCIFGNCSEKNNGYKCTCSSGYSGKNCDQVDYCSKGNIQAIGNISQRKKRGIPKHLSNVGSVSVQDLTNIDVLSFSSALSALSNAISCVGPDAVQCLANTTFDTLKQVVKSVSDPLSPSKKDPCGANGVCISGTNFAVCLCKDGYFGTLCEYKNCTGTPLTSWSDCFADDCTKSERGKRNRTYVNPDNCYGDLPFFDQCTASCEVADPLNPTERTIAIIFQTMGCIILLGLLGTVFTLFVVFRVIFLERMLHMCQEIALLIGHAAILVLMELKLKKIPCSIAGMVLQYSFLANYTFLALEGIQTYCTLTNVVTTGGFFSGKVNLAIGWLLPFGITGATAAFKFDKYPSTYSCWLNLDDMICAGSIIPIAIAVWSTVIFTEAATMGDIKQNPLTPHEKYIAAHVSQKLMILKLVFNVLSWTVGMWSMYAQKVYLFGAVSALNMSLGFVIFFSHTSCNEKVIRFVKTKVCKKKLKSDG